MPKPSHVSFTPSHSVYDHPRNYFFCGSSWIDASTSCETGGKFRWCPGGSNDECEDGESCWADTTCNMLDYTLQPTLVPTGNPTTGPPTGSPIRYDDPSNTNFCGSSFCDAEDNCSVERHCPSGSPTDCPNGGYCWVVECNIPGFVGSAATPAPNNGGSEPSPILVPTGKPTAMTGQATGGPISTGFPTTGSAGSLILNGDLVFTNFCGSSYLDAEENCSAETQCPSGSPTD